MRAFSAIGLLIVSILFSAPTLAAPPLQGKVGQVPGTAYLCLDRDSILELGRAISTGGIAKFTETLLGNSLCRPRAIRLPGFFIFKESIFMGPAVAAGYNWDLWAVEIEGRILTKSIFQALQLGA